MNKNLKEITKFKKVMKKYLLEHEVNYLDRRLLIINLILNGKGTNNIKGFNNYEIAQAINIIKRLKYKFIK